MRYAIIFFIYFFSSQGIQAPENHKAPGGKNLNKSHGLYQKHDIWHWDILPGPVTTFNFVPSETGNLKKPYKAKIINKFYIDLYFSVHFPFSADPWRFLSGAVYCIIKTFKYVNVFHGKSRILLTFYSNLYSNIISYDSIISSILCPSLWHTNAVTTTLSRYTW